MAMITRSPGEMTTLETRHDSHESVDKRKRYSQIVQCLREYGPMTARECAEAMRLKGYIPTNERNWCAPRLTEMSQKGMAEPIGKKECKWTGKMVAVYAIREEEDGKGNE